MTFDMGINEESLYVLDITYDECQRFNAIQALGMLMASALNNSAKEEPSSWIQGERIKEYILRLEKKIKTLEKERDANKQ